MHITKVLIKPLLTEKNYIKINQGKYVFKVHPRANKNQIKTAFQTIFEVKVDNVNVINTKPKPKRMGRYQGEKKGYKKAIISLAPGESLELFNENK